MSTTLIGQLFPDFSLPAAIPQGENIAQRTLSNADFQGKPLVLFFYPRDATDGRTIEVCGFRDLYPEFEKLGVEVSGVSRDTIGAHKKFITNQNLPYPLLADKEKTLIQTLDLIVQATMYGKPVTKVLRNTYLLDSSGKVRHVFEKATPLGHAQEVLDWLRENRQQLS